MKLSVSQSETLKIKQWPAEDRPREKMRAQGRRALSNAELLAIILGSGNKHETAVDWPSAYYQIITTIFMNFQG